MEVQCLGVPLHEVGEAGRGVLLHDDEEAIGVAVGGHRYLSYLIVHDRTSSDISFLSLFS